MKSTDDLLAALKAALYKMSMTLVIIENEINLPQVNCKYLFYREIVIKMFDLGVFVVANDFTLWSSINLVQSESWRKSSCR